MLELHWRIFFGMFIGLILANYFYYSFGAADRVKKNEFLSDLAFQAISVINSQMASDATALRSGVGLYAASKSVERNEWQRFLQKIALDQHKSGMLGMGVVLRIPRKEISSFEIKSQKDDYKDFKVHTLGGVESDLKYAYPILYVEPFEKNRDAIGLDLASELNRRLAAEAAIDSGTLSIS